MGKVVIVLGSPRKESNTHILVKEAQKGFDYSNIQSEVFFINDMNVRGCQACYFCKKNNVPKCKIKDDMQKIYKAVEESNGILIASPIYFGGVTSQTKILLDRFFPYIDMNVSAKINKGKKASFIFTQNQPYPELFISNINSFKDMFAYMGFEIKDSLIAYNLDKGYKPLVTENLEFMKKAYALGRKMFE